MKVLIYNFNLVCKIQPELNELGEIRKYFPHRKYKNTSNKLLLKYGSGPFCKFTIPNIYNQKSGVYLLVNNDIIKYVGECADLLKRFNNGYGHISPRNCYEGGQSTNCRINSFISDICFKNEEIYLYFKETNNRFEIENKLITKLIPVWNRKGGRTMSKRNNEIYPMKIKTNIIKKPRDKYLPLKEYLMSSRNEIEFLSFEQIETILESNLPKSAYTYNAWWSNGGHKHADSWLDAGWVVDDFNFGKYVKFIKK